MNTALNDMEMGEAIDTIDEIREMHPYHVVVEFRGLWRIGTRFATLNPALQSARDAWSRSRLKTQVRGQDGVVFAKFPE